MATELVGRADEIAAGRRFLDSVPGMTTALVEELGGRAVDVAAEADGGVLMLDCSMAPRDETCSVRVLAPDDAAVDRFRSRLGLDGARATELIEVISTAAQWAHADESELGRGSARDLLDEPGVAVGIGELGV